MASEHTSAVIASALALPEEDRLSVIEAIQGSLLDAAIDHGPAEPQPAVQAAWRDEVGRRLEEVRTGRVTTVSATEAERMIRGDALPEF